jgi:predicted transcriptional regulator
MLANEVFAVARAASCNKYERDGRPLEHLWKDVIKASRSYVGGAIQSEMLVFPELTEEQHSRTFIDDYTDYGIERTDAYPEYHKLCAFVLISTLVATSIRLDTNDGTMVPNLYGLILGPSTLARKSTVMGHAMSFLMAIDPSLLVANDATPEGLLNALATRPNRASIFHRDEVSGFFNQMNRREYMSHMMEILSALYDVPPVFMRTLRKESFRIDAPVFVLLAGGVDTRVYEAAREDYVTSGFFPRFLVVSGKPTTYIPMGPPVPNAQKKNTEILNKLADIYEIYGTDVSTKLGNATAKMPPRIKAQLTQDAWIKYNEYELILKETAENSIIHDTALPTFIRFSKSILKMAVILGAVRQIPEDGIITIEESDLINAAWYAQKWGQSSVELAVQAGRHVSEKIMDKILKFIEDRPGVLKGKIMQNFGLMKKEADAFLETLEERGYIRKERRGRGFAYWIT